MIITFNDLGTRVPNLIGSLFEPSSNQNINNNYLFLSYLKSIAEDSSAVKSMFSNSSTMIGSSERISIQDHKAIDYVVRLMESSITDDMHILIIRIDNIPEVIKTIFDSQFGETKYRFLDLGDRTEVALIGEKDFITYIKMTLE